MNKRITSLFITILMLMSFMPGSIVHAAYSGSCGENLTWVFDNGTLTISGTGDMTDWGLYYPPWWYCHKEDIDKIIVENGVTSIGKWAFADCISVTSAIIPDSVTRIGESAFRNCTYLSNIEISDRITTIGDYTFYQCSSLKDIIIPKSVTAIGRYAFCECRSLKDITVPNRVTSIGDYAFYECSNTLFYVTENSYAHKYVADRNMSFVTLPNQCQLINRDELSNIITKELSYIIKPQISEGATYEIYDKNSELIDGDTVSLTYGENKFTIKVMAKNGGYAQYHIVIYVQLNKCELLNKDEISTIITKELSYTIKPQISEKATYAIYDENSELVDGDTVSLTYGENKFTIKVTAENDEYAVYPITIRAVSDKCELLNVNEISNITTKELSYTIKPQVSERATYTIYDSNSKVMSETLPLVYGENKFTIKVTAETGTFMNYPIVIYVQSNKCELLNVNEISNITTKELSYTIKPQISERATYTIYDSNSKVMSDILPLVYGENKFIIKVTAENGQYMKYPIMIYVQSNKCELLNKAQILNITTSTLRYTISPEISNKATYEIYDSKSELINSNTVSLEYGNNAFTIKVTAENGEYAQYPINIYAKSDKCELLNIDELKNITTKELSYTITPQVSEKATYQIYDMNSNLLDDTLSLVYGENKFVIKVIAENGAIMKYPITVRAVSDKCELLNVNEISNITTKELSYTITPQVSERATYTIYDGNSEVMGETLPLVYGENKFTIKVIAETGTFMKYPIVIYVQSNKCELLNKSDISNIVSKNLSYTIEPQISENAAYQIYDRNHESIIGNILQLVPGENKFTLRVTAENGEYAEYPMMIYAESNECNLFNQGALSCEVSNTVSEYLITPQVSDKASYEIFNEEGEKIAGDTVPLIIGENAFMIKVTAENGIDYESYTITIKRREKLSEVISSCESGYYAFENGSIVLRLANDNSAARIYYTTDGTEPTTESSLYENGITVDNAVTIKAFAVLDGCDDSDVTTIEMKSAIKPTNLKIQSVLSKSAVLVYSVPDGVKRYEVYHSTDRGISWSLACEGDSVGNYINVPNLIPQTEYMFKVRAYYSGGTSLETNAVLGKTAVYISNECDILNINSPFDAVIDNDSKTIMCTPVMNAYNSMTFDVEVSDKASWHVYLTRNDANMSKNEITDKVVPLNNEGAENNAYIKVVAEDGITEKIYTVVVYRQSKSAMPSVSINRNYVLRNTKVELFADGEIIKYTTDGSEPSEFNGTVYNEPIVITDDTILRAVAKEREKDEYSDVLIHKYWVADDVTAVIGLSQTHITLKYVLEKCTLVVAEYKGDNIVGVKFKDIDSDSVIEIKSLGLRLTDSDRIKVFLWKDLNTMEPIALSQSIKITVLGVGPGHGGS